MDGLDNLNEFRPGFVRITGDFPRLPTQMNTKFFFSAAYLPIYLFRTTRTVP